MDRCPLPPPEFRSDEHYAEHHRDAEFWKPYVRWVFERHGLPEPVQGVVPPLMTNPVFLINGRWAVKLFTPFFYGHVQMGLEAICLRCLAGTGLVPAVVAEGDLYPGASWTWPYFITELLAGRSLELDWGQLDHEGHREVARQVGEALAVVHAVDPGPVATVFDRAYGVQPGWKGFLADQLEHAADRHREWGTPEAWCEAMPSFLGSLDLAPAEPSVILHGDLDESHIFGSRSEGDWTLTGLLDYGDAKVGDRRYDFLCLHLSQFQGDRSLLGAFLEGYGPVAGFDPQTLLGLALLHDWDILSGTLERHPDLVTLLPLEAVADRLFAL